MDALVNLALVNEQGATVGILLQTKYRFQWSGPLRVKD